MYLFNKQSTKQLSSKQQYSKKIKKVQIPFFFLDLSHEVKAAIVFAWHPQFAVTKIEEKLLKAKISFHQLWTFKLGTECGRLRAKKRTGAVLSFTIVGTQGSW